MVLPPQAHRPYRARRYRPRLEVLEDRSLPSAVLPLTGFSLTTLARGDNNSALAAIGFSLNYFGTSYTSLYVNTNGNVTFDRALSNYDAAPLVTRHRDMLAPFFSDVDTRPAASG